MKDNIYIINSPEYPKQKDFEAFPIWCQWEDAEEYEFLKGLCDSEHEFEQKILSADLAGKETYYPIQAERELPYRLALDIKANIDIDGHIVSGYLSCFGSEVVALTIWAVGNMQEVSLFRSDRLGVDENIGAIESLAKALGIAPFESVSFKTPYVFSNGQSVSGLLQLQ